MTGTHPFARAKGAWPIVKRSLSWGLMVAALCYLLWILRDQAPALVTAAERFHAYSAIIAVAAFVPMFILKAIYQGRLLGQLGDSPVSLLPAVSAYLQAQLVRYLPGKVWGLVYQSRRMRNSRGVGIIVAANFWQMLMTNLFALGIVAGILGIRVWGNRALLVTLASVLVVEAFHRLPWIRDKPLAWLSRRFPAAGMGECKQAVQPDRWISTSILSMEWIFFLLGFVALLHGLLVPHEAVVLAAWYGAASILALAAFMVPAGLAVREAIFISSGALVPSADPALLLVTATMLRFIMISSEALAAGLVMAIQKVARNGG